MDQLKVRDLMQGDLVSVSPDESVARVRNLMYEHWVRFIPVIDKDGRWLGLVTYRDLLRRSLIEQSDRPVWVEQDALEKIHADEVAQHLLDEVGPDTDLREAGRLLLENKKGCLPVTEDGRLVGLLTEGDFVKHVLASLPAEEEPVREAPSGEDTDEDA